MHRTRATMAALIALGLALAGCAGTARPAAGSGSLSVASGRPAGAPRPADPAASVTAGHAGTPGAGTSAGGGGGPDGAPGGGGSGAGASDGTAVPGNGPLVVTASPPTSGLDALYKGITVNSPSVSTFPSL